MKYLMILCLILFISVASCKKNEEITVYNTEKSFIYFAVPNQNQFANEKYIDTLLFSFVFEDINTKAKRLGIPVNVAGVSEEKDRDYKYVVNTDSSTINLNDIKIEQPVIHAGKMQDTLFIDINKTEELETGIKYLYLTLQDNDNFKIGNAFNSSIKIGITNNLSKPQWWDNWANFFGPYYHEVYQKWINIYYLGADPSPDLTTGAAGPFYYWDNMPPYPITSWYPVTFIYIQKLNDYFEKNVVYPDGDSTKSRILLP